MFVALSFIASMKQQHSSLNIRGLHQQTSSDTGPYTSQIRPVWINCLQGYLYVEAHKESHVTDAIKGLRIIRVSKGARLVPLKEMVSAIYVNTQAKSQLGVLQCILWRRFVMLFCGALSCCYA